MESIFNLNNSELKNKNKISTSKLLILFLFLDCIAIEIYTCWAMSKMLSIALITGANVDFSPLLALIGAIVGEVIAYAIYSLKSLKENTRGGIVYDSAINSYSEQNRNIQEEKENE